MKFGNNIEIDNLTYEERIIAFIDILGFRNLVNETVEKDFVNQAKLTSLVKALNLINEEFESLIRAGELPYSFMITYFSDSIVLSLPKVNTVGLLSVFEVLKRIQIKLVNFEILLRGGIVVGKVIHQPNFILGPAMIEAYDLESKSALYPRITIDPDIMEILVRQSEMTDELYSVKEFDFHKTFEADFDNTYYIDYFSDVTYYLDDQDVKNYYQKLRQLIKKGVKRKNIGIRMKYMWMLKKFNQGKPSHIKGMAYKEFDELGEQIGRSLLANSHL